MFIFETENRFKLYSHNGHRSDKSSVSFLFKKPIISWILDATLKEKTLVYGTTSLGDP